MFVILLLATPALCEWVEISQHHVMKPTRTHSLRPIEKVTEEFFEETTSSTKIYLNQSLGEPFWSKGNINKVPKIGNVQRVKLDHSPIKAPSLSSNPVINTLNAGGFKTDMKESVSANVDSIDTKQHKSSGNPENERYKIRTRVSTSNIEKVHLQSVSNTEPFQVTPYKDESTKTILSDKNKRPLNKLDRVSFNNQGSRNPNSDGVNSFNIPTTKQKTNVTLRPQIFGFGFEKSKTLSVLKTGAVTSNIDNDVNKFPHTNTYNKALEKTTNSEVLNQKNKHTQNTFNRDIKDDIPKIKDNVDRQGSVTGIKLTNHEFVAKVEKPMNDATVTDEDPYIASSSQAEPDNQNSGDEGVSQEEALNNNKVNSLENLMTFMKVVADTIRKNTRKSVKSKTRYLKNLKDTILENIAGRIDAAWPDDEPAKRSRVTRAAHGSSRGHLEIPSSESALMTISFLTFAVFLIKLVLQVIQTYKNKAMMVAPAVVAVGRVAMKRSSTKP